jgi:hypothetical protein
MEPNLFAYVALLLWPLVSLALFQSRPIGQAILWTVLGGYLLLPVRAQIKFEMIPAFDKSSIPNLAALLGCLLVARQPLRLRYGFSTADVLLLMLLFGPFITSQLNTDPIVIGGSVLPGVGAYDALSSLVGQFIYLIPFFLGRQFLRSAPDNAEIMRVLVVAGLLYSLPMLFEIRMSPQLHTWIYGYFPHSFGQQIRDGGFRPVVFLGHGLLVAFFGMTTAVAAAALWRIGARVWAMPAGIVAGYLGGVLVLCKTLGALVYGAVLIPLVRFASPRLQMRVAMALVAIALLYPMLRAADLFPTRTILEMATSVSEDRAQSLEFRFENEDQLLAKAWERFWFGWGRFGRNRVFDEETGDDISVTDGRWIITMGQFGIVGFLGEFGLLALSVVGAASAIRYARSDQEEVLMSALALMVAVNIIDLLPNSSISPWTWLLVGALLGRAEDLRALAFQREPHWSSRADAVGN